MDSSIDALKSAASKIAAEQKLAELVSETRSRLVLGRDAVAIFFASIAMRMKFSCSFDIETACTNGRDISVNPEWFNGLSTKERMGVMAHEIMHIANRHHTRRGNRDIRRWNIACDLAINHILQECGFSLPKSGCFPGQGVFSQLPRGKSAEEYYQLLEDINDEKLNSALGLSAADPGKCGAVEDFQGDPAEIAEIEAETQIMVSQAESEASKRGTLPSGISRIVQSTKGKVDWREALREFVQQSVQVDYTWSRPNRRFIDRKIYLPSIRREEHVGEIVIAVDTSGSIGKKILDMFAGEIDGILSCEPVKVHVLSCDCEVRRVDTWEPSDGTFAISSFPGGGGTSHVPIWDWLSDSDTEPACVICLTDGDTDFGQDPGVPVLWALTKQGAPPFGKTIILQ